MREPDSASLSVEVKICGTSHRQLRKEAFGRCQGVTVAKRCDLNSSRAVGISGLFILVVASQCYNSLHAHLVGPASRFLVDLSAFGV